MKRLLIATLMFTGCNAPEAITTTTTVESTIASAEPAAPIVPSVTFPTQDAITIAEGSTSSLDLTAQANVVVTYSCPDCPSFASINATTGQLSLAPAYTDSGSYTVTVYAQDAATASAVTSFGVSVSNTNRSPSFAVASDSFSGAEVSAFSLTLSASDPDSDSIVLAAQGLPSGASASQSGNSIVISWTPGYTQSGTHAVTLTATDGDLIATKNINIVISNTNRLPSLNAIAAQTGAENSAKTFSVSASDPDSDATSITLTNTPSGASFNGSTFSWTPSCSQQGTYNLNFRVSDGAATNDTVVPLTIAHVNCAVPTWSATKPVSFDDAMPNIRVRVSKLFAATDSQHAVTMSYTGIYYNCFNTLLTYVSASEDSLYKIDTFSTSPASGLTEYFYFLYKAQDPDGATTYAWQRMQRMVDGTISITSEVSYPVGATYAGTAEQFCVGTVNPNGFYHTHTL